MIKSFLRDVSLGVFHFNHFSVFHNAIICLFYFNFSSIGNVRIISHYAAAVFTARRNEMCEIVEVTFRYLVDRPQVHSEVSGLPFMVSPVFSC